MKNLNLVSLARFEAQGRVSTIQSKFESSQIVERISSSIGLTRSLSLLIEAVYLIQRGKNWCQGRTHSDFASAMLLVLTFGTSIALPTYQPSRCTKRRNMTAPRSSRSHQIGRACMKISSLRMLASPPKSRALFAP